jgi:hypothetical protein
MYVSSSISRILRNVITVPASQLNGFPRNLMLVAFTKIYKLTVLVIHTGQSELALYMKISILIQNLTTTF